MISRSLYLSMTLTPYHLRDPFTLYRRDRRRDRRRGDRPSPGRAGERDTVARSVRLGIGKQRDGCLVRNGDRARADIARLVRSEQSGHGGLPAPGLEAGAGALVSRRGESRLVRRSRQSGNVAGSGAAAPGLGLRGGVTPRERSAGGFGARFDLR